MGYVRDWETTGTAVSFDGIWPQLLAGNHYEVLIDPMLKI